MDEVGMPTIILTVVVALMMLAVGSFVFYVVYSEIGYSSSQEETFNVTDPTIDNSFELKYFPTSISSVEQYNGIEWQAVDSTFYSSSGNWFTILSGGMQG